MIIIFKSQQNWVQRCHYTGHQNMTSTQVSSILSEKNWPGNHMGLLPCKAAIPGLCSQSDNTFYIIWRVILRRLPGCCSIYNKDQSIHFTNKPFRVAEIIGMQNDAIHEPIPGHQLNFLWQNAVSDVYIFDHQRAHISLGSMLVRFYTTIKVGSLWDLKLCEMQVLDI